MKEEKTFCFMVTYKAFVTDKTYVNAKTKEEAIQKIKDNSDDVDILDSYTEYEELDNIEEY